jgi:PEP-CTERM motif
VKNLGLSLIAIVALGVGGTTPVYASSGGGGWICKILPFLCPPAPGGNGPPKSVPEPATIAVLAAGVAASLAARRRRNKDDKNS